MQSQKKKRIAPLLISASLLLLFAIGTFAVFHHIPAQNGLFGTANAPSLEAGRKSGHYNFLCLGRDRASCATDVMLLCSYDVTNQHLFCLQLPRDTYFAHGNATRLNAVFATEKQSAKDDLTALSQSANILSHAFGIPIDYTALIYLDGFSSMIDRIGGVEVDVPFDMHYDDPSQGLSIHLNKGLQVLNGAQAEQFVRFRKGKDGSGYKMGDLGRLQAQKLFLASLLSKVKSLPLPQLLSLIPQALDTIKSDLTFSDAAYFLRHAISLDLSSVQLQTLPGFVLENQYIVSQPDTVALLQTHFAHAADDTETHFDTEKRLYRSDRIDHKNRYFSSSTKDNSFFADDLAQNGLSKEELSLQKPK